MPSPKKPFRINIGFIAHEEIGRSHDFPFEFDKIVLGDDLELRNFDGITELYAFDKRSETDSELILPEDGHIGLAEMIREYALLEVPISPICKPECQGLCAECGQNLNEKDCGHKPIEPDSPFAKLKDLLN